jgi:hypothetical protein
MSIEDKMKQALAGSEGPQNPDFQRLRDFYEEKKKEGVIKKQEYTIPPMDTIGRVLYTARTEDESA